MTEEFFVDGLMVLFSPVYNLTDRFFHDMTGPGGSLADYTMHCTVSTTRGYFELASQHNNNTFGPLLEKWPSPDELAANFNDRTDGVLPTVNR